ncbi:MAG: hypothetical protein ACD_64C00215G0002 [uncultured bacterium]|nr:MAG: hypothetical protein ACD_64C00215G0002 [uncultured bacterium]
MPIILVENIHMKGNRMRIIPSLSDTFKGIILIVAGMILLLNTLGITTKLLHSIILFGSIAMIVMGIFMADVHKKILSLMKKNDTPQEPKGPHNPQMPQF